MNWKWTQIRSILLLPRRNWKFVSGLKWKQWERLRSKDCSDSFAADTSGNFFPPMCCDEHKKHDKREPGLFREEFKCTEMLYLCSKAYCCYDVVWNKFEFSRKSLNKRVLEQSGGGPWTRTAASWMEKLILRQQTGFRTNNHTFATYEQVKRLCYFYPKTIVVSDGIYTQPLNL